MSSDWVPTPESTPRRPWSHDLNSLQRLDEKGQPLGYAELDAAGHVPSSQLPVNTNGPNSIVGSLRADGVPVAAGIGQFGVRAGDGVPYFQTPTAVVGEVARLDFQSDGTPSFILLGA